MGDVVSNIGPAIAKRRKELGISLEEVARRADTSKSHIWDLEKGNSVNPTISMLLAVSSALNTSINTLLGTDISQPILSDDELELIQHHRRIFGKNPRQSARNCLTLVAEIEHLEHALGEHLSDEDAAMVKQIERDAVDALGYRTGAHQ
jgi:transcriptional regulator with XRE-family HTH domain